MYIRSSSHLELLIYLYWLVIVRKLNILPQVENSLNVKVVISIVYFFFTYSAVCSHAKKKIYAKKKIRGRKIFEPSLPLLAALSRSFPSSLRKFILSGARCAWRKYSHVMKLIFSVHHRKLIAAFTTRDYRRKIIDLFTLEFLILN